MTHADLISSFTPSTMPAETLEAMFVQREPLAQRMISSIRAAVDTGDLEHHLAVGPRGMGKTHLLSLVAHRLLADDHLRSRIAIAWLREEEWGVTSLGELFEQVLTQLADADQVDHEVRTRASDALDHLVEVPLEQLADAAEAALPVVLGDRLLVIVVENLDQIFQDIGTDDQHQLRAFLQNQRNTVLLASTPSLAQSIAVRSGPFFGFFAIHHLDELSVEEARQLLVAIATLRHDDEGTRLVEYLGTDEATARLKVVEHIAGGHPRLWVLMAECITTERLEEVVGLLMAVLDDLTPYYQAQMKALSAQQRKIVMHLSRIEGASTVKDLAAAVRIQERVAATQLGQLVKLGYVRKAELPEGFTVRDKRTTAYELREPLLRHVLEVKESRGKPLRLIVELLRAWYDDTKLTAWVNADEPTAAKYARAALERPSATSNGRAGPTDSTSGKAFRDGNRAFEQGKYEEALAAYEEAAAQEPGAAEVLYNLGITLGKLDRIDEALAAFDTAIALDPYDADSHFNRGVALGNLRRPEEALAAFDTAAALNPNDADTHYNRGVALVTLGRSDEAVAAYDVAIALVPDHQAAHYNRGVALTELGRNDEALAAYDKAIALDDQDGDAQYNRAIVLARLGRIDESLAAYASVIAIAPSDPNPRFNRASIQMRSSDQAIPAAQDLAMAVALAPDAMYLRQNLTWLLTASAMRAAEEQRHAVGVVIEAWARASTVDAVLDAAMAVLRYAPGARSETWTSALLHALEGHDASGPLVDLLRAIVDYRATGDGAVLLRLPSELRDLATEILEDQDRS
ncbi:MAG: tetratricopeptide repeat protein [Acidimicrobiales bacterium]